MSIKRILVHLSLMNNFTRYFFVHDQLNYACARPFYLANMMDATENDVQTWEYLKDNISMSKSEILLMSIGSDHAMEQENRNLEVRVGVIGLTKPSALDCFCLTAPILNALSNECCKKYDIKYCSKRRSHYHFFV